MEKLLEDFGVVRDCKFWVYTRTYRAFISLYSEGAIQLKHLRTTDAHIAVVCASKEKVTALTISITGSKR